ncbi:MAG: hypothetical protein KA138_01300 [Saprospiraceae bacterium]|nr:hypothetical protein [Saprospiraceae bacterium]
MRDITVYFRDITGKDEETVSREELDRINKAANSGEDFLNYYKSNKIYFDSELCKLIEEISAKFTYSHSIIADLKRRNLEPSRLTFERTNQAINLVREEAPPLISQLEERLRAVLEE